MAGRIEIDTERCKGCGLCVVFCPKSNIVIRRQSNRNGYFPADMTDGDCTGCANCAIVCPDAVIKVFRDSNIASVKSETKSKLGLIEEKT
ncbi:MAG: 4Fe-4S dicluster domain-containing protein [Planctomycetota bacterium]|jgi:2-oxoglutarate ferredoxin oxidoreductase subunit delta